MLKTVLLFIAGLVCLIKGGDDFVDGATGIARHFHLPEILDRITDLACENLQRWKKGEPALNVVDFSTGYKK